MTPNELLLIEAIEKALEAWEIDSDVRTFSTTIPQSRAREELAEAMGRLRARAGWVHQHSEKQEKSA